jgi:hypothetical protein
MRTILVESRDMDTRLPPPEPRPDGSRPTTSGAGGGEITDAIDSVGGCVAFHEEETTCPP